MAQTIHLYADALSKWVIFKANCKGIAGEEGKNKGKQREKEEQDETLNSLRRLKTRKENIWVLVLQNML